MTSRGPALTRPADKVTKVLADGSGTVLAVAHSGQVFIVAIAGYGPEHAAVLADYLGISAADSRRAST